MNHSVLEVCADCVQSAVNADNAGADRIELCSNLVIGGVTPGMALFKLVKKYTAVKVRVLLRPRYGDYCYSAYEFEQLKEEVQMYRELGADGMVIGILRPDGRLDVERMSQLIKLAGNMDTALHRAFDACLNPMETMEQAVSLGMKTILTGGQCGNAWDGRELLKELYEKSAGRIEILAAGGINAEVMEQLILFTGITSYHMSGKIEVDSMMTYRKAGTSMGLPERDEYDLWQTSGEKVKQAVHILKGV